MKPIVLDTLVVSFLFKADSRAQIYLPHLGNRQWLVSFMTEAELEQWALMANWSDNRVAWLRLFLSRFTVAVELAPAVSESAKRHRLVCYDPQNDLLTLPQT